MASLLLDRFGVVLVTFATTTAASTGDGGTELANVDFRLDYSDPESISVAASFNSILVADNPGMPRRRKDPDHSWKSACQG